MATLDLEAIETCMVPPSRDFAPMKGPMHWDISHGCQNLEDCSTKSPGKSTDTGTSGVLQVLEDIQQQLEGVLQGQAELQSAMTSLAMRGGLAEASTEFRSKTNSIVGGPAVAVRSAPLQPSRNLDSETSSPTMPADGSGSLPRAESHSVSTVVVCNVSFDTAVGPDSPSPVVLQASQRMLAEEHSSAWVELMSQAERSCSLDPAKIQESRLRTSSDVSDISSIVPTSINDLPSASLCDLHVDKRCTLRPQKSSVAKEALLSRQGSRKRTRLLQRSTSALQSTTMASLRRLKNADNIELVPSVPLDTAEVFAETMTHTDNHRQSRSAFDSGHTEDEDKAELRAVFLHAEHLQSIKEAEKPLAERARHVTLHEIGVLCESFVAGLILLNSLLIGVSMDAHPTHYEFFFAVDAFFSTVFILELLAKMSYLGPIQLFTGDHRYMNTFDALLILSDIIQLAIETRFRDEPKKIADLPPLSLFRIVRLVRLARIVRLLQHPVLETFLMMLHGILGGLPTLGCALLVFIFFVYFVALLFREFLGRDPQAEHIFEYFSDVPRSMVTTFRCSFGECTTISGAPIFEHVDVKYGVGFSLLYCLFAFAMSIGMFNVISAIFVQSTMAAATALQNKNKKERLQNESLWASRVTVLVKAVLEACYPWRDDITDLSKEVDDIYELKVETNILERLGNCPIVIEALEDLDVDPEDHTHLADILDVEQSGNIAIIELLQGIKRLRGNPRRSDIVAIDLTCRAMQNTLKQIQGILEVDNIRKNSKMSVDTSKRSTAD
eukprot:TRINITY_DN10770_c0_g2_i5.p1 TRINITY_DN10770_c0_g2~~TRINITY_DN10770_c0_g2_i5.p1  ORF type:complete len:808 (+),score=151.15 TRINITY_DN10770_c0_g2_i5:82-2424(+)